MVRPVPAALILVSLTVALAGTASAATRPSERACLIAWNSPANHANRARLLALRPITRLELRAGVSGTVTWKKGSPPTETSSQACFMTVAKRGQIELVTGIWKSSTVSRWVFGRPLPTSRGIVANVRLLADGRVTKIYRR